MDFSSKSPKREFSKDITSKIETPIYNDKDLKIHIDKPDKPRNKIERSKIDINKEPRNKIQREKIDLSIPPRNKIEHPKFDPKAPTRHKIAPRQINPKMEPKHKLQPRITDHKTPTRHKIETRRVNPKTEPIHKLQLKKFDLKASYKNRIEISRPYSNLMNPKIQSIFKKYYNDTRNYPNYGRKLTKDFIKWVVENNPEINEKIKDIQFNQEISNYIKDRVKNLNISQSEIASNLYANGLFVSRKTVGNYALKEVFKGNQVEYKKRFDRSFDVEFKERIINRLNKEVVKNSEGVQHDSLYKIAKEFPEVSKSMIDKIAKKEIPLDAYRRMWPSTSGTVDLKTKQKIRNQIEKEVLEGTPRSLRNISEEFPDESLWTIKNLAKKMYPEKYKNFWPAIEKIPKEIRSKIKITLKEEAQKENPRTLREIHRGFPEVGADSIKRIAKQFIHKDVHDKIWPSISTEIPKEIALNITQILKKEINKPNPRSLNEIGRDFDVSTEYIRQLAKKSTPKQVYEKTWKAHEPITNTVRNNILKDILNTKLNISEIAEKNGVSSPSVSKISQREVFQNNTNTHRERFPIDENLEIGTYTHLNLNALITKVINNIPNQKYYAEPNIYKDKRRPDGLILEDNNFIHQRLLNIKTGGYLRNKLELTPKDLNPIKNTQFDFTSDISDENLIKKIEKYQSEESLLIIVGTRWFQFDDIKPVPNDERIKYPETVRVISHTLGADLIGIEGNNKELFERMIDFNNNHDLNSLKAFYNYDLSSTYTHSTEELKEDLIQKGLIKEDFCEYFNFDEINKNDTKKKQLDLGHFLNF